MFPFLQVVVIVLAAVVALLAVVAALRDEQPGWSLVGTLAAVELALLVQLVIGLVQVTGTDRDLSTATFLAYLIGVVLVPPIAFVWAAAEQTRWGTAVLAVGGVTVIVLVLRLEQIWAG